jgi:pyridoxamine 5'-phosphate oxidase
MAGQTGELDPLAEFERWYDEAVRAGAPFPDAMTLATATPDGRPSARIVLYKGMRDGALCFFTNYESRKGRELAINPRAAVVFHWPLLERQVRIEGTVERIDRAESEAYFQTRPRESQLGACVSPQSRPIASRDALERAYAELDAATGGGAPACPEHWGGYRLIVERIELWRHREARLHERTLYERADTGWRRSLLAP